MGKSNKKTNISSSVWIIVLVLVLLVLATSALVASFIKRYIANEKNVIEVMIDAGTLKDKYDDPDLPAGALPDMDNVSGDSSQIETETSVNIFKDVYTNADGEVVVESANGDKIIAPGTSNDYHFTLKNTGNISLDYDLILEGGLGESERKLPFFVRLRLGNEWIIGGEDKWVYIGLLGDANPKSQTLPCKATHEYVFEWLWPLETDKQAGMLEGAPEDMLFNSDANDTYLGDFAPVADADFNLNIKTSAVVTPGAVPTYGDGTEVLTEFIFVCVMVGIIVGCIVFIILLFINRKIFLVGFISPSLNAQTKLDGKEADIVGTYVTYPKVRFGAHTLELGSNVCKFKLRAGKVEGGVSIEAEDDTTVITLDRSIKALELHFLRHFHGAKNATVEPEWAAIDKHHNVYTPNGVTAPDPETKENRTPNGLSVDKQGKFSIQ